MRRTRVCIFELNNRQLDYAQCFKIIRSIECAEDMPDEEWEKINENLKMTIGFRQRNFAPKYLEEPMNLSDKGRKENAGIFEKHEFTKNDLIELITKKQELSYHIRVYFGDIADGKNGSNIINLQYLAMLLKYIDMSALREIELKKWLSVFLVPRSGATFPYQDLNGMVDYELYDFSSVYLRLLSKQYNGVIYGVKENSGIPDVTSLNFHATVQKQTYSPLLMVDCNRYGQLFGESIIPVLSSLLGMKKNERFGDAANENPNIAVKDYVAEAAAKRIREVMDINFKNWKVEKDFLCEFLSVKEQMCYMHFLLFAFLLSGIGFEDNVGNSYEAVWNISLELIRGIKQIVQNAIQHSNQKECFFTFYLRQGKEETIEISISDINDKEDMLDNFVSNLNYEVVNSSSPLEGHKALITNKDNLAIRNLFSEFEESDEIKSWRMFRKEDIVAHTGLVQFAEVAERCNASIKVLSCKDAASVGQKHFYYKSYDVQGEKKIEELKNSIIPGTQFFIIVPVRKLIDEQNVGLGQLIQEKYVREEYKSYANFLDYEEKRIEMFGTFNGKQSKTMNYKILDARKKYRYIQEWKEKWREKYQKVIEGNKNKGYEIYNFDCSVNQDIVYFRDADRMEVFIKGMISAFDIFQEEEGEFYIAFTNLPEGFVEAFRIICVLIGIREFPCNLQIFMQEGYQERTNIKRVIMSGNNFLQAIRNSYTLSLEQGAEGFERRDYISARRLTYLMGKSESDITHLKSEPIDIMPFDVILGYDKDTCLFELQLQNMAEGKLDKDVVGYKLEDTHMRLGSKVHIGSFYEMSFLFYRTTIANRIAFMILRRIKKDSKKINILEDNILFYGYASYSKAILTSITEILRAYKKKKNKAGEMVEFATFQHNLMLESEDTQMYFSIPFSNKISEVTKDNRLIVKETTQIVQVVPISSTLTTFKKMWSEFLKYVMPEGRDNVYLSENYTVFWVVDEKGNLITGEPSEIEKMYWERVVDKTIETKLLVSDKKETAKINFFIRTAVMWNDPLKCELCYPENVLEEIPLVETDSTSTVPSQQIRYREKKNLKEECETIDKKECEKIRKLEGCVLYDHICRRQNHYQIYIDTKKYFHQMKVEIKKWLVEEVDKYDYNGDELVLNIIFSPEHNTNVGFAQYVNTYYFKGMAEIVSINVDKQFRSNFICEHAALKQLIENLQQENKNLKDIVRFYFVDDTIITGSTIQKANGFLHSLVPQGEYPVNLFSKIFLLVERLSDSTKAIYVDDVKKNFLSYLHIDVSNVRTHGDSCIGCKLEKDARRLLKRSATQNMAQYWAGKVKSYKKKNYDDRGKTVEINRNKSYRMLLFSHIVQNIIKIQRNYEEQGRVFDILMNVSNWLLNQEGGDAYGFGELLENQKNIEGLQTLFKVVSRPFLTYEFAIKRQVFVFFILMAEIFMGNSPEETKNYNTFVNKKEKHEQMECLVKCIKNILKEKRISQLEFLSRHILECLTDMRSTYIMRKESIRKSYQFASEFDIDEQKPFWEEYEANIHRMISGSSDETKELWLEYLYMTGKEYREYEQNCSAQEALIPETLYTTISKKNELVEKDKYFFQFCHGIFLQNMGINFDQLEKEQNILSINNQEDFLKGRPQYWKQMNAISRLKNPLYNLVDYDNEKERELFEFLAPKKGNTEDVGQWYKGLLKRIVDVLSQKYGIKAINIALLSEEKTKAGENIGFQTVDIIEKIFNSKEIGLSETQYCIKKKVIDAVSDKRVWDLKEKGYYIGDRGEKGINRPYIIAFFANPKVVLDEDNSAKQNIIRVYMYISVENQGEYTHMRMQLILREIMTYRNRIMRCLQKDFAGDLYARYARENGEKNIISHEKAYSHNATADDEITLEVFQREDLFNERCYKILKIADAKEWLLLRNYTNSQIAKIFNQGFHEFDEIYEEERAQLYIKKEKERLYPGTFKNPLRKFGELNLKNESDDSEVWDKRIELITKIVDIKYEQSLRDAEFIKSDKNGWYNLEYFKCIIIDILISAIKAVSREPDYLMRIDALLNDKKAYLDCQNIEDDSVRMELLETIECNACVVEFQRRPSPYGGVDFLVIKNRVNIRFRSNENWGKENSSIKHRLEDPLDFADGHMSLLAIKRYIENLDKDKGMSCSFEYVCEKKENDSEEYYFENCLPVLKRNGETRL